MATWLLAAALALSPQPPLPDAQVPPDLPTVEEIMAVPPELQDRFRQWMAQAGDVAVWRSMIGAVLERRA